MLNSFFRRFLLLPVAAAAALLLGCPVGPVEPPTPVSPPAQRIEVIATEFRFNPSLIYAEPGQPLIIPLRNLGAGVHSIVFELPGRDVGLDALVAPLETRELRFTAPSTPGDYTFYCPVGNHRELGMEGVLRVANPPRVRLAEIADGLTQPVAMAIPPDASRRRFIVDQIGMIRIVTADGRLLPEPFLDWRDRIVELNPSFDERGLLGLAFHPDYAQNGRFFIYYSAPLRPGAPDGWNHTSYLSELRVQPGDPDRAKPGSEKVLLAVDQPQANHNAGTLIFGPTDGYLYLSLGDGGGAGDLGLGHTDGIGNGQDRTNLLGSILRLDVSHPGYYVVPPDNPFVGEVGADEIYAYGMRNPYRMSFDMAGDHDLLVGDVGQALYEEVSVVRAGDNHGWNILEGTHCFNPDEFTRPLATCPDVGPYGDPLLWPALELPHSMLEGGFGQAVIGGYVYRGAALPALAGRYVFGMWDPGDEVRLGQLHVATAPGQPGDLWHQQRVVTGGPRGSLGEYVLAFGQDEDGELYALTSRSRGPTGNTGRVLQLVRAH